MFLNGVGNRQLSKANKHGERRCNCKLWHQTFQRMWCVLRLVVWTFDVLAPKVFATYHCHLTISDSCCWGKLARTTQRVIQVRERHLMFADSGHHCRLRPMYSLWNLNWLLSSFKNGQEVLELLLFTIVGSTDPFWPCNCGGTPSCSRTWSRPWSYVNTCHILSYC